MNSHLAALTIEANDPQRLARFWAGVLGWAPADRESANARTPLIEIRHMSHEAELVPDDDTGFRLRFLHTDEPKSEPNQMHFDLTSTSLDNQQETVARALALGATHLDVGQLPEEGHIVLADPEGNEFCVIEPGNNFLADCGFVGALASDGSQAVGYFWSAALGWPLVWDQDEETAIRSPHGGPKITWGGPPVRPKTRRNRLHFDLDLSADADLEEEVDRLTSLGARRVDGTGTATTAHPEADAAGRVALLDPDGNEFCVLAPH